MGQQSIDEFLAEADELLEKLSRDLAVLGDGIEQGELSPDLLNGVFRDAHSVKGLSGMFGFNDIADLAHHLETLLDKLRLGKITLNGIVLDLLFETVEGLGLLVRGKAADSEFTLDISTYVHKIENLLEGPQAEDAVNLEALDLDQALLGVLTEYEAHRLQENLRNGAMLLMVYVAFPLDSFDRDLLEVTNELQHFGEVISTLPGTADNDPSLLAFRLLCASRVPLETLSNHPELAKCTFDLVAEARGLPQTSVPQAADVSPQMAPPGATTEDSSLRSVSRSVRVDIAKLDALMNIVGELGLAKGGIGLVAAELSMAGVMQARDLEKAVHILERRISDLQKAVTDVRMVPVRQLFDKMERIIRRMSQELGKKVELSTYGSDTEFDKLIAEELAAPLMHIIRNALDHGIESGTERRESGKTEIGQIELRATQSGNHVVLDISDDGKGIDIEVLRQKGIEKGLLDASAQPSRQELFGLLFQPGFSTRDEVSEYSGRGVGMDVVKNNISALSGMIDVDSSPGEGTCISLTLPITLAIVKALVVHIQGRDYAIPLTSVLETLMLEAGMVQTIEGQEVIELRRQTLPLLRLTEFFGLDSAEPAAGAFVVVAGLADRRIGIVVDELRGQQDVVIKSLGQALSFVRGIAGAADFGNQKTVLVLDVSSLVGETLRGEGNLNV